MKTTKILPFELMITGTYLDIRNEIIENLIIDSETISGSKFENTTFTNISFLNCNFQSVEITKCTFINCEFKNCSFNFLKVKNCNLIASGIENCIFCITNSLNCNFLSCSYIANEWHLSKDSDSHFTDSFLDAQGLVPSFHGESHEKVERVYDNKLRTLLII